MGIRFQTRSDLYVFGGYVLLVIAVLFNPFTIPWLQNAAVLPVVNPRTMHTLDIMVYLPLCFDAIVIGTGALMIWGKKHLRAYFNNTLWYNIFLLVFAFGFLFSANVILPGRFRILRVVYILALLFLLTNTLYQAVIKKRKEAVHPFYKNMALLIFSLFFIFLILEITFMFFTASHRFNGSLASRAWFSLNWELNSEGYRDREYVKGEEEGKRKIMVLGDSFVSGHGIKNPEDRFSNHLAKKMAEDNVVYNLGLGGSDVLDAFSRLQEFPLSPDLLIFSYYPNDIEKDGQLAGKKMGHPESYGDVFLPFRFLVRRSYVANYLYWMYPHYDTEMFDYRAYLDECYQSDEVMHLHLGHIDSLQNYCDSLSIPMVALIWPQLEDLNWSKEALAPVINHFSEAGLPTLFVGSFLQNRPLADLIVNPSDAHANASLNAEVADSLYALMKRNGLLLD